MILSLDPSSTCVGYAVLDGLEPNELCAGGLIVPSLAERVLANLAETLQHYLKRHELIAYRRILSLIPEVEALLDEYRPDVTVVEIPSGKFGTGAKHGARGSLTTYGLAVGMVIQACNAHAHSGVVVPVTERQWTAGLGDKQKRQRAIAAFYRHRYTLKSDAGGDLADAIGLGSWWFTERQHARNRKHRSCLDHGQIC